MPFEILPPMEKVEISLKLLEAIHPDYHLIDIWITETEFYTFARFYAVFEYPAAQED
jgi:hypothetical protein